ncbi:calcium/proton exchanger, partial [Thelephora ganbajun]
DQGAPSITMIERVKTNISKLLVPDYRVGKAPGFVRELRTILFGSWFNLLLLTIPVSWALHFAKPHEYTLVFIFSFLAIIPLAKLLAFATDELSIRVGETLAGLLNATLGNAVELIVAIIALVKCELRVVQSSLVGSILSNLLFVLGLCFFAGGTRFSEQGFALSATQLNSSLLTLSVIGVLIPAAFNMVAGNGQISGFDINTEQRDILKISHGTAIVLLIIYISYLIFQLFSHRNLYDDKNGIKPATVQYPPRTGPSAKEKTKKFFGLSTVKEAQEDGASVEGSACTNTHTAHSHNDEEQHGAIEVEEEEIPELSLPMTIALLVVVTVLVAVTAEWLVDSIDGLASGGGISKEFIGLILLPIVGNAAEHVTAVTVSVKDKLTLSLGVAVGSSIQIALFVIPFIVILGWIIGRPITMLFDPFESIVLFLSVLTVNYVVQDGRSNWLEGMILMCLYVIVALVFWFYPGTQLDGLLTCATSGA